METLKESIVSFVYLRKKVENKEKIIAEAGEMFMRYGVRSVTMDDVGRELGMSKKTLYQFFTNKDDLVLEVSKAHIEHERVEFGAVEAKSDNALNEFFTLTKCVRRSMQRVNPSLLFDLQKYHPSSWDLFLDFKLNFIRAMVERNVRKGIEEGYYRKEMNPEVLAKVRMEQVQMVFDPKIFSPAEYDLVEVQMQVLDHFIHGLLSDKGRELYHTYRKQSESINK
ncbi:MAG: TetR/AcrR family transcriptional regulator [Cytophagales bacterium]|nr:TetR/AcrR family transcriptional regulator [Cytophagales bacterium]